MGDDEYEMVVVVFEMIKRRDCTQRYFLSNIMYVILHELCEKFSLQAV